MKKVWLSVGLISLLALPASAQKKEEERVDNAGKVMQEILNAPDSIPRSVLDKADCVVVLPSVVKFAVGIGGSYGRGVMTCPGGLHAATRQRCEQEPVWQEGRGERDCIRWSGAGASECRNADYHPR